MVSVVEVALIPLTLKDLELWRIHAFVYMISSEMDPVPLVTDFSDVGAYVYSPTVAEALSSSKELVKVSGSFPNGMASLTEKGKDVAARAISKMGLLTEKARKLSRLIASLPENDLLIMLRVVYRNEILVVPT